MSRKQQTTATFAVRVVLPVGTTVADWKLIIKNAISGYSGSHQLPNDAISVTVTKRETTYGN